MWIEAAIFYDNLVCTILQEFDPKDAACIEEAQQLLLSSHLQTDLTFIVTHFSFLPSCIKQLQKEGLPIIDALKVLDKVNEKLATVPGSIGDKIRQKFAVAHAHNPDVEKAKQIAAVIEGTSSEMLQGYAPTEVMLFMFCPMASADVERSFSVYKHMLTDRRHSLKKRTISKKFLFLTAILTGKRIESKA